MITRKRCKFCNHDEREQMEESLHNNEVSHDDLDKSMGWPSGTTSKHFRNHMGEYVDSSNPRCVICTSPGRRDIEIALHNGDMSATEVAEMEGCSEQQVMRHMRSHLQPLVQQSAANIVAQQEMNEIDIITNNVMRLDAKLDVLLNDDDVSPKAIDSLTKLAKEVRESLKYALEFKGKLVHKRQDTVIVHQMQVIKEVLAQNHPDVWLDVRKQMESQMQ